MFTTKYMKNQPKPVKQRVKRYEKGGSVSNDKVDVKTDQDDEMETIRSPEGAVTKIRKGVDPEKYYRLGGSGGLGRARSDQFAADVNRKYKNKSSSLPRYVEDED